MNFDPDESPNAKIKFQDSSAQSRGSGTHQHNNFFKEDLDFLESSRDKLPTARTVRNHGQAVNDYLPENASQSKPKEASRFKLDLSSAIKGNEIRNASTFIHRETDELATENNHEKVPYVDEQKQNHPSTRVFGYRELDYPTYGAKMKS